MAWRGLPICGISFEEAVDFFLNFDKKDFDNPRLQIKKESFTHFYENIEKSRASLEMFSSFSDEEIQTVEELLKNGLPEKLLREDLDMKILVL